MFVDVCQCSINLVLQTESPASHLGHVWDRQTDEQTNGGTMRYDLIDRISLTCNQNLRPVYIATQHNSTRRRLET